MIDDMIRFFRARLDEEENIALAAHRHGTTWIAGSKAADDGGSGLWESRGLDATDRCDEHDPGLPNHCDDVLIATFDDFYADFPAQIAHAAHWNPAAVLADIAAKRALLDYLDDWTRNEFEAGPVLSHLLLRYRSHRDYNPDWKP